MKLPFVSRERYDEAIREREAWISLLRDDLEAARDDLRQMRVPTATLAVAPQPVVIVPDESEQRIRKAINENAVVGGKIDSHLQAHLRQFALELKRQKCSTDQIVEKLGQWVTSEPTDMAG